MDRQLGFVVVDEAKLPEFVHEEIDRERVVPTICARCSWLMPGATVSDRLSLPKCDSSRSIRASRFSRELNS